MRLKYYVLSAAFLLSMGCSEPEDGTPEQGSPDTSAGQQGQNPGQQTGQNPGQQAGQNPGQQGQNPGQQGQNPGQQGQNPGQQGQNPGQQAGQNPGSQNSQSNCRPESNPNYPQLVTDEDWARALVAGTVPADVAFPTIAYSCGFPVITDDNSVIFIHWYEGESWSVAGDLTNWETKPMAAGNGIWSAELPMPGDIASQNTYKFVKNNDAWQSDPWSLRYDYDDNGEISYITKPANKQHLMRWHDFKSPQGLKSRSLHVLVPPNDGPYDVVYAHDGQNIFQTDGYSGGWRLRENMSTIGGNFLIVGIANTEDRMNEYTHVDDTAFGTFYPTKGNEYAAFVEESVRPFIESRFQTTAKAGVMGSSLGGLISLYIAHKYPNRYRMVLALSPTTAWGRFGNDSGTTIADLYEQAGHRSTVLYLDNGGNEPQGGCSSFLGIDAANLDESEGASAVDNMCYTRDFLNRMVNIGYQFDNDLYHWHEPGARHDEKAWAARVFRPLQIFMGLK